MVIRAAAVAGMFYPGDAGQLMAAVDGYLSGARRWEGPSPKAVIAPHAGYIFSGPIAGSAYAALARRAAEIKRVVLIGPSHRVAFDGVAVSQAAAFATPLGSAMVDRAAIDELLHDGLVAESDLAHVREHSLEVHLPFLQSLFPNALVLPLLAGGEDYRASTAVLSRVWGGAETVVVVSSDLSHYHNYQTACRIDATTAKTIESLRAGCVNHGEACGATPVNALLEIANAEGLRASTVDLRNSGDTAGPRSEVVGYGAFVFA